MLHHILTSVSSLGLAERLRLAVQRDHGCFSIKCPACSQDMWLDEHGFLCSNQACSFYAGNVVDFLKVQGGFENYGSTIRHIVELFQDRCSNWTALPLIDAVPVCARECRVRRDIFDFFRQKFAQAGSPQVPEVSGMRAWLVKMGLHPEATDPTLYPLSYDEQIKLRELSSSIPGASVPEEIRAAVIAAPFYSNHHTITSIDLYEPRQAEKKEIVLSKVRFSYFGLHLYSPKCKTLHLTGPQYFNVSQGNTHFYYHDTSHVTLGVRMDASQDDTGFLPEEAIFHSPRGVDLTLAEQLMNSSVKLSFSDRSAMKYDNYSTNWEEFLFNTLCGMLNQDGRLTDIAKTLIGALSLNTHIRQRLIKRCYKKGLINMADSLQRIFRTTVVYQNDKLKLCATPDGYQTIRVKGGGGRDALTNFVLELHNNVIFKETGSLFHSGIIAFEGERYPIMLSSKDIDSPAVVEESCQRVVIKADKRLDAIPVIRDRLLFKHVSSHLRDAATKLPQIEGIDLLGWSSNRRIFYGSSWKTTMEGTEDITFSFHPDVPALSHFTSDYKAVQLLEDEKPETPALKDLAAMIIACVARKYLNYPTKGVMLRQDASSQLMIETVFRQLGQTTGLRRSGSEVSGIFGFPVYGYGYNQLQLLRMDIPMFSLSTQGLPVKNAVTEEEATMAGAFIRKAIVQTCEWLMATGGEGYTRIPHVLHASELMEEGKWLFENALSSEWDVSDVPYVNVENLLRGIPFEQLGNHWRYDFQGQKVILFLQGLKVDLPFLETELRSLSNSYTTGENCICIDAGSGINLLNHFYGREVTLPQIYKADYQAAQVNT